ncbi:MAG: helicase, partial [Halapricum sp.]
MTDDDADSSTVDALYDALEALGQPVVTATRYAQHHEVDQDQASDELDSLSDEGSLERQDVSADPVVYYPSEWARMTDRERVIVFPERRQLVVDKPQQFTRAQLSQFARLIDTTGSEGYLYGITQADIWQAPYEDLDDLLGTVRDVLPDPTPDLEDWIESQWERAHQFTLRTHQDGYVVLEAASEDLMGNVARQKLE